MNLYFGPAVLHYIINNILSSGPVLHYIINNILSYLISSYVKVLTSHLMMSHPGLLLSVRTLVGFLSGASDLDTQVVWLTSLGSL